MTDPQTAEDINAPEPLQPPSDPVVSDKDHREPDLDVVDNATPVVVE